MEAAHAMIKCKIAFARLYNCTTLHYFYKNIFKRNKGGTGRICAKESLIYETAQMLPGLILIYRWE
jgi:hypothetical protein